MANDLELLQTYHRLEKALGLAITLANQLMETNIKLLAAQEELLRIKRLTLGIPDVQPTIQ